MDFEVKKIKTKILIVGGGTAGCYAALSISRKEKVDVVIAEKANIIRSGCLAAGVNALNAYISKGHVPNDYVEYAKKDGEGIVRPDLSLTLAELFNEVTRMKTESMSPEAGEMSKLMEKILSHCWRMPSHLLKMSKFLIKSISRI